MKVFEAGYIAERVITRLLPFCERIEIAGSIRRLKPEVKDIELVAIPKMVPSFNMFGEKVGERSMLNDRELMAWLGNVVKAGPRYVQVELVEGINLDLFVVMEPADWAVIMAIRTGPAEFSKWLVTNRSKGGALPNGWKVEDGRVWDGQTGLKFGEEVAFLEWLDLGWIEPGEREAKWNKFGKTYLGGVE